jgi:hypothetical protein
VSDGSPRRLHHFCGFCTRVSLVGYGRFGCPYRSRVAAPERALAPRFALGENYLAGLTTQCWEDSDVGREFGSS